MGLAIATLFITQGTLDRQEYRMRQAGRCVIGRGDDCDVRLKQGFGAGRVSRRHCLFDFDPPWLRVCDLGSLNGTFVNGKCVGQRPSEGALDDCPDQELCYHDLQNGDVVRVGHTVIRVVIARVEGFEEQYFFPSVLWL